MALTKEHERLLQLGAWLDREVGGDASQKEWDETVSEYAELERIVAEQYADRQVTQRLAAIGLVRA